MFLADTFTGRKKKSHDLTNPMNEKCRYSGIEEHIHSLREYAHKPIKSQNFQNFYFNNAHSPDKNHIFWGETWWLEIKIF